MFKLNLIVILVVFLLVGCGSPTKVTRIDENATTDLSGDWNDTDARLTAEEMVRDALSKPWREDFTGKKGTKPTVIVGKVTNRSLEHIDVQTFVRQLERSLLNSGTVSFVAGGQERKQVREEIKDQAKNASDETMKGPGQETGADFMLTGNISSIVDQEGGETVKYYQINMELIELGTNQKVWIGEKKIKKHISRDRVKF